MLLAMATGTGKTKLAIALLYRLLSAKRFRRVCFVVDRNALGNQAAGEFETTRIVSAKTFADIFGLKGLKRHQSGFGDEGAYLHHPGAREAGAVYNDRRPKCRRSTSTT